MKSGVRLNLARKEADAELDKLDARIEDFKARSKDARGVADSALDDIEAAAKKLWKRSGQDLTGSGRLIQTRNERDLARPGRRRVHSHRGYSGGGIPGLSAPQPGPVRLHTARILVAAVVVAFLAFSLMWRKPPRNVARGRGVRARDLQAARWRLRLALFRSRQMLLGRTLRMLRTNRSYTARPCHHS
jgi:hypothetical protein